MGGEKTAFNNSPGTPRQFAGLLRVKAQREKNNRWTRTANQGLQLRPKDNNESDNLTFLINSRKDEVTYAIALGNSVTSKRRLTKSRDAESGMKEIK